MTEPMQTNQEKLKELARQLRLDVLEMTTLAASGHPSSRPPRS